MTTTPNLTDATRAGRRQFLLLTALFAAPIVAAVVLYNVPQLQPQGRTHHGTLIDPARPLPALELRTADGQPAPEQALRGRWSLLYLGGADCAKPCADKLFEIRQVRALLNEKRQRVQRVYLAPDAAALARVRTALGTVHPDLVYLADAGAPGARAADFFGEHAAESVYLIDPLGNWLMVYAPGTGYKDLLSDIKKLLRLSQIG